MLSDFPKTNRGILSAFIGFCAFACADACAKWLGSEQGGGYDVLTIMIWSYLISLFIGFIFIRPLGGINKTLNTHKIFVHIGRGICGFGIAICVVNAMKVGLPLANMYTILFLSPFLITLGAWPIYKEPVSFKSWSLIALGFSGILIAFRPGLEPVTIGELYAFGALGFIVGLSLLARPLDERESLHSLSFYPAIIIIALSFPVIWDSLALPAPKDFGVFLLNGLCVTVGLSGIAYGFRLAPYALVAPIHYIQMIIAFVAGYFVFGDVPDLWMLAGAGVIIVSGVVLAVGRR